MHREYSCPGPPSSHPESLAKEQVLVHSAGGDGGGGWGCSPGGYGGGDGGGGDGDGGAGATFALMILIEPYPMPQLETAAAVSYVVSASTSMWNLTDPDCLPSEDIPSQNKVAEAELVPMPDARDPYFAVPSAVGVAAP